MNYVHADLHVPGSAGEREWTGLAPRGHDDAMAQRPRASEHPDYNRAYDTAALRRRVAHGEAIMAAQAGIQCRACGYDTPAFLFRCGCKSRDPANDVRGMYVLFASESDIEPAEFRSASWVKALMQDGTALINVEGDDISHHANPLQ